MIDPRARGKDFTWLMEIIQSKPCKGKPWGEHEYTEPLDMHTWSCVICGDCGPFEEES
jgi:hypothetical protein